MLAALQRTFQIRLCHLIDNLLLKFVRPKTKTKTLLVLRLDAIGDYVLFRNYLEILAKSKKYQGYKITLCGNTIWQSLAREWDSEFVDSFIWLDRKKFYHNPAYRFEFQKKIRKQGFEVVLNPVYSRLLLFGDAIVKVSGAKIRIGNFGNTDNLIPKEKKITDKYYSKLIQASPKIIFEFDRNKEFFEHLLEEKIDLKSPQIQQIKKNKKTHLVVFAGASEAYKRWNWKKFAILAFQIAQKYDLEVILVGSKSELEISDSMMDFFKIHNSNASKLIKFTNLTTQTSLLELSQIIADSELLLTNETVAVHLAVIPSNLRDQLVSYCEKYENLIAVTHGYAHLDHSDEGEKKCEFSAARPRATVFSDVQTGLDIMKNKFADRFAPMFVPPWNRFSDIHKNALQDFGYEGFSTFTPRSDTWLCAGVEQINTHVDPIDWHGSRSLADPAKQVGHVVAQLRDRRLGKADNTEPYGLLTHHLVHDADIWAFTEAFLQRILDGPSQLWTAHDLGKG